MKRFNSIGSRYIAQFELRAAIALELLYRSTANFIAADDNGEDSAGRQKLRLQTSKEIVEKAFTIADGFMNIVEERGDIKDNTIEDIIEEEKRIEQLRYRRLRFDDAKTSNTNINNNQ